MERKLCTPLSLHQMLWKQERGDKNNQKTSSVYNRMAINLLDSVAPSEILLPHYRECFDSFAYIPGSSSAPSCASCVFNFLRKLQNLFFFPRRWHQFIPPPIVPKFFFPTYSSQVLFSTSLPTPILSCLFSNSHSDRCEASLCGFVVHFPDD